MPRAKPKSNAKKTRSRIAGVSSRDYKINPEHTVPRRAADYLNWLAERAPGRWVKWADLFKIVHVLKKKPTEESRAVDLFKKRSSEVDKALRQHYGRCRVPGGPYGVRASTDEDDLSETGLQAAAKRLRSAGKKLAETHDLIDPRKLKRKENKDFYERTGAASKLMTADAMLRRLELPAKPEEK
jgi:hypothetical protein